ncbi:MAG: hypothetical protein RL301_352, partial [Actinomycetota bacterium]
CYLVVFFLEEASPQETYLFAG